MIDQFERTEDPIRQHHGQHVMISFLAGLFVGGLVEVEQITDNLELERLVSVAQESRVKDSRSSPCRDSHCSRGTYVGACSGRTRRTSRVIHRRRPGTVSGSPRTEVPKRGTQSPQDYEESTLQEKTSDTPGQLGRSLPEITGILDLLRTVEKHEVRCSAKSHGQPFAAKCLSLCPSIDVASGDREY